MFIYWKDKIIYEPDISSPRKLVYFFSQFLHDNLWWLAEFGDSHSFGIWFCEIYLIFFLYSPLGRKKNELKITTVCENMGISVFVNARLNSLIVQPEPVADEKESWLFDFASLPFWEITSVVFSIYLKILNSIF